MRSGFCCFNKLDLTFVAAVFLFFSFANSISMANVKNVRVSPTTQLSLLEISTRPWLYSLCQKYGVQSMTLDQVPDDEWVSLAQNNNFDFIWLMGVWELGGYGLNHDKTDPGLLAQYKSELPDFTIDDVIGSPYAVVSYSLNPQIGSSNQVLVNVRKRLNQLGLRLMLDFVPNHSAVDCPWMNTSIDYYIRQQKNSQPDPAHYLPNGVAFGSACSGCGSWPDTAQLNYWNPNLVQQRIQELTFVASMADGIRCDMAYLLLNDVFGSTWQQELQSWGWNRPSSEFWGTAISFLKAKFPQLVMMAEVYSGYETNLQSLGFDYTYDKTVYDKLTSGDLDGLRSWISQSHGQYSPQQYLSQSAHFTSNHDQQRAVKNFGTWWQADAAALVTFTLPGLRFYWMWEENGFSSQIDVHLRREYSESVNPSVRSFFNNQLWNITMLPPFRQGQWEYLNVIQTDSSSSRLIAYKWTMPDNSTSTLPTKILCVLNYSDQTAGGKIILSDASSKNGSDQIEVVDLLSGTSYWRSAQDLRTNGLTAVVNSWYAQLFSY